MASNMESSSNEDWSINRLIEDRAGRDPEAPAILAPGRRALSSRRLAEQVRGTVSELNQLGIGGGDCLAVVLPNGPEMAVAFLAAAATAACAPLNPAYRAEEFDFYLGDLKAGALLVQAGMDTPARAVAQARGIPIIELAPASEAEAGVFTLEGTRRAKSNGPGRSRRDRVALLLHTSGTTARPKLVPLTHGNLLASVSHVGSALALSPADRCLNIMPLFHIHGLVAALLASLGAGGSVVCSPGFEAGQFLHWLEEYAPTWYTAVPTMHQAILAHATSHPGHVKRHRLRFIRSSSASLPPTVMAELERLFQVPVIEAYGMTEAAHQMATNPLPPLMRKPGSVGVAMGPEIAVLDEAGHALPRGTIGEIAIRGPNVLSGYAENPSANEQAFTQGWFRTGDQGYLDFEGYLFLTGRLKELVNRGGEKVAPREVEDVLLAHEAVEQAVVFAVPHPTLGEDVAAAVVLRANRSSCERELQRFAALRLAEFKVPRQIIVLSDLPKGPTGKIQRIGMAERLGLARTSSGGTAVGSEPEHRRASASAEPTLRLLEEAVARIYADVLKLESVAVHENFFVLGGDSIRATQIVFKLQAMLSVDHIDAVTIFQKPTVAELCEEIVSSLDEDRRESLFTVLRRSDAEVHEGPLK